MLVKIKATASVFKLVTFEVSSGRLRTKTRKTLKHILKQV